MMILLGIVIGILVVFAITALTGYFVAQELSLIHI